MDIQNEKSNFVKRENCELCGSNSKEILFSEKFTEPVVWDFLTEAYGGRISKADLAGGKYEIARCLNCGFIWQTQVLNDRLMGRLYDYWISPQESLARAKQAGFSTFAGYAREAAAVYGLVGKSRQGCDQAHRKPQQIKVLDFGCGWGYWCMMAKAFGYDVCGFEIEQTRLNFAKQNGIKIASDSDVLRQMRFDFINAESVFEHLADPLKTLKLLAAGLKDNGVVRISVPNGRKFEKQIKKPGWLPGKGAMAPLEHISCFTHQVLVYFGRQAGLKIAKQPFLLSFRSGIKDYVRAILGRYYKRYFGRALYFKKN